MNQSDLLKMKMPELRAIAKKNNIPFSIRWLKPKMISEIVKGTQSAGVPFEPVQAVPCDDDFLADDGVIEKPTAEPLPVGRGGVREGAGRPEGTDDSHIRLKRAIDVKQPDLNIKNMFDSLAGLNKKDKPEKLIENTSLYITKTGEYFGVMDKVKNTPIFIIGSAIYYTFHFFKYLLSKGNNESGSKDNTNIRSAGNGQEQSSKESFQTV